MEKIGRYHKFLMEELLKPQIIELQLIWFLNSFSRNVPLYENIEKYLIFFLMEIPPSPQCQITANSLETFICNLTIICKPNLFIVLILTDGQEDRTADKPKLI